MAYMLRRYQIWYAVQLHSNPKKSGDVLQLFIPFLHASWIHDTVNIRRIYICDQARPTSWGRSRLLWRRKSKQMESIWSWRFFSAGTSHISSSLQTTYQVLHTPVDLRSCTLYCVYFILLYCVLVSNCIKCEALCVLVTNLDVIIIIIIYFICNALFIQKNLRVPTY